MIDQISAIVDWYKNLPKRYDNGAMLIDAAKKLSSLLYEVHIEHGTLKNEYFVVRYQRKARHFVVKSENADKSAAKALIIADSDSEVNELSKQEAELEGVCARLSNVIEGAENVLRVLQQHISLIRTNEAKEFS